MRFADLIVQNAVVRTMDDAAPRAQAVAFIGGRVAHVGDNADMAEWAGRGTEVLDAGGRTVLPGLTDSHTHFHRASMLESEYLDFATLDPSTLGDVLDAVKVRAGEKERGEWVQGDSLDPLRLDERRFPTRHELDAVTGGLPTVIRGVGRHVVAANSVALELAGIDRTTQDPAGGRLERDANGEPTGVLHERGKLRLDATQADTVVPALDQATRLKALRAGFAQLQRLGITTIHDIMREPREISDYILMRTTGELGARIRFYPRAVEAQTRLEHILGLGLRTGLGDDMLRLAGIKVSVDGNLTVGNAALYEPYPDDGADQALPGASANYGLVRVGPEVLRATILDGHEAGLQVAVHAIGQRALDIALNAFEDALGTAAVGHHHRIEHGFMPPRPGQLARMAALGLVLSTQPSMLSSEGDSWLTLLGEERVRGVLPMRSALDAGLHVQINSDYPCSPLNPFIGVQAAVERRTRAGVLIGADEAITVGEALAMMTTAPAQTLHEDDVAGRLAPGYLGDAIVLSDDPWEVPVSSLAHLTVEATVLAGHLVHSRL
ncbi:amidohydrolase [Actinotalea sp. Marseille-Q4924]|uniref:amidohydrolase n=1 Tax=Actinotalea sp. Marseille-Q4924 TaxID=2866571 RepID=UPI001CE3E6C3|nr:amidohydrolase [Actinotalea sp. Marseille-Q4924]